MKIITVGTLKGGTGKTIFTFSFAGILAETKRVLLIDADPQTNLSSSIGIDVTQQDNITLKDMFESPDVFSPEMLIIKNPIPELPNLDIISGSILLHFTEVSLIQNFKASNTQILREYIIKNEDYFNLYDYIVIDTNPSMGLINQNAFFAADKIIMVLDIDWDSAQGAELFMYLWSEIRKPYGVPDNVAALVVNKYESRTNYGREFVEYLVASDIFAPLLIPTTLPMTVRLKETKTDHKPINITSPNSIASDSLRDIIDGLYKKGVL